MSLGARPGDVATRPCATTQSPTIAVAASGNTAAAAVGSQLGRSPFFLLFDPQGDFVSAEANPYKDSANAGIPAADFLVGKGVKIVVAEGFGTQIVKVMTDRELRALEFKGSAKDAARKAAELR